MSFTMNEKARSLLFYTLLGKLIGFFSQFVGTKDGSSVGVSDGTELAFTEG